MTKYLNSLSRMAIFIVDVEFRSKAKQMMTRRETLAVLLFLVLSLLPWVDIMSTARDIGLATWDSVRDSGSAASSGSGAPCNPHTRACL